jgi:hypothetical protein
MPTATPAPATPISIFETWQAWGRLYRAAKHLGIPQASLDNSISLEDLQTAIDDLDRTIVRRVGELWATAPLCVPVDLPEPPSGPFDAIVVAGLHYRAVLAWRDWAESPFDGEGKR